MVTSISESKRWPRAWSARARPPALGFSRCRYGEPCAWCFAGVKRVPYSLADLLPAVWDADLLHVTDAPDAFLHEEPASQGVSLRY